MPFYRVLEEEYFRLHPDEAEEKLNATEALSGIPTGGANDRWTFTPEQFLDAPDLARRLEGPYTNAREDMASAIMASEAARGESTLRAALAAYTKARRPQAGEIAARFTEALAAELNVMLDDRTLSKQACVRALSLNPYVAELRSEKELPTSYLREANRLFLEAAFPTQLQRVRDISLNATYARIRTHRHAALCLSGGGIRSATFALGVAQGLARARVLVNFDYISTVSGGGYLGGWLSSWMHHTSPEHVQAELQRSPVAKLDPEPAPIKHLRTFTNYLSPNLGLLSADTWTLVATYLRNVLLNWLVIVPLMAVVVLIPWAGNSMLNSRPEEWGWLGAPSLFGLSPLVSAFYAIGFVTGIWAVAYAHAVAPAGRRDGADALRSRDRTQLQFIWWCLGPLVLSAILLTTAWSLTWDWNESVRRTEFQQLRYFTAAGAGIHFAGWLVAVLFGARARLRGMLFIVLSGAVIGALSSVVAEWLIPESSRVYTTFAMPAFLMLLMAGGQLYLGVSSRGSTDAEREWGARFNAWIFIVIVGWTAFSAVIVFGPGLVLKGYNALVAAGVGGVSGLLTLVLGGGSKTSGKPKPASTNTTGNDADRKSIAARIATVALGLAAPVFAVSIIVAISAFALWLLDQTCRFDMLCRTTPVEGLSIVARADNVHAWGVLAVMLALLAAGLVFGYLIDTNSFSLHAMYRARLIRAYLGASRPGGERHPDAFTGFDENDDILVQELWPAGESPKPTPASTAPEKAAVSALPATKAKHPPMHVVNVTLNLVGGDKLAWQERKAESFTVTSLHAGSAYLGYRRTSAAKKTAHQLTQPDERLYARGALSLGTAVTISGAAASPNMGYHSSSAVAFLMTLFNARLGAWFGNPGPAGKHTFNLAHPRLAIKPILSELFALSDDRSNYVYLSDGGHFENLGLYEMVLRRCRCIVLSDASCDAACSFEDLGNAIRKIRIDLGVPIEFLHGLPIFPRSAEPRPDAESWAFGLVRYSAVDNPKDLNGQSTRPDTDFDGVILYIKPTFYAVDEPRDVYNYAQNSQQFPHEPTSDQFFSESQFESYRALGEFIVGKLDKSGLLGQFMYGGNRPEADEQQSVAG